MRSHVVERSEDLPALLTRKTPGPMHILLVSPDIRRICTPTLEVVKIAALCSEGGGPLLVSFPFLSLLPTALPR